MVVITGGSRGIGAACARLLAASGYDVAVSYVSNEAAAAKVVEDCVASGARATAVQADLSVEEDVVGLIERAEASLGHIRALVNNAGITGGFARVDSLDAATIAHLFAVNVNGTVLASREAVKRMSTRRGGHGGAIVNLSSIAARTGGSGEWVPYAATKGAVNSFTLGLAREVADEGIRVNAVAPGLIDTELHAAAGQPDRPLRLASGIPMKRPGSAEEVAEAVAWLLSDKASYITGSILEIGGGR
jgi:NAD(P)-dependent dehydrogenase (short-subunit alcohol dehydrogenase family)